VDRLFKKKRRRRRRIRRRRKKRKKILKRKGKKRKKDRKKKSPNKPLPQLAICLELTGNWASSLIRASTINMF
jgi:hypothetical protein